MAENRTRYAVLGALTVEPMSGYDLKRFFEQGVSFFWTESYGQIYPILKQLKAEGLVADAAARRTPRRAAARRRTRAAPSTRSRRRGAPPSRAGSPSRRSRRRGAGSRSCSSCSSPATAGPARPRPPGGSSTSSGRTTPGYSPRTRPRGRDSAPSTAAHPDLPFWLTTLSYGEHVSRALVAWCDEAARTLGAPPAPEHRPA
jgi:hypothetical protein